MKVVLPRATVSPTGDHFSTCNIFWDAFSLGADEIVKLSFFTELKLNWKGCRYCQPFLVALSRQLEQSDSSQKIHRIKIMLPLPIKLRQAGLEELDSGLPSRR